ncbi:response regulator [Aquabacterium sp. J223]|uniref:response regulator n=1 Tax=Aquabacterium sp. J223 TaxID=2898431 RepID=UPI0021AE26FD|nr:response regulator transcription factor [Aquabacterium sp. J223]UUX96263.1 response regulator transcription factor [Aquabacterium sp. J223]
MRVLMVEDHLMVLQGLKLLLGMLTPQLKIDTAVSMEQAEELVRLAPYELVLLDWKLQDSEGLASFERLRGAGCTARIVVMSGDPLPASIAAAVEGGAAGFIPKHYASDRMVQALSHVIDGGVFVPHELMGGTSATPLPQPSASRLQSRLAGLTQRQVDVYLAAARGLPNKLIARELGIAESTVKTHLSAVYEVLGVRNRTEAARQAAIEGFRIG